MPTVGEALQEARRRIEAASDSASQDAQALLGEVLSENRAYLLAHPERQLTPEQFDRFDAMVNRCAAGEPLAYILGRRAFYDREFVVSPAVLIPRPETELLLEEALGNVRSRPQATVVDVGTGSGALAVTLAANCPQAQVYATDISPEALAIAQKNAAIHHAQVTFLQGSLLRPLIDQSVQVDVVMANLPYIASDDVPALDVSRYEPLLALDGGADGLDLIRKLVNQIPAVCRPQGLVLLEIGADQGERALRLVQEKLLPRETRIIRDYAGLDRVVRVRL
jgi:release factor glutamine methyltransferase